MKRAYWRADGMRTDDTEKWSVLRVPCAGAFRVRDIIRCATADEVAVFGTYAMGVLNALEV